MFTVTPAAGTRIVIHGDAQDAEDALRVDALALGVTIEQAAITVDGRQSVAFDGIEKAELFSTGGSIASLILAHNAEGGTSVIHTGDTANAGTVQVQGGTVIAFDDLADGVGDRLQRVVARRQAIGAGDEAAGPRRQGMGVVGVHRFIGNPRTFAGQQVDRFDPENLRIGMPASGPAEWQPLSIRQRHRATEIVAAGKAIAPARAAQRVPSATAGAGRNRSTTAWARARSRASHLPSGATACAMWRK